MAKKEKINKCMLCGKKEYTKEGYDEITLTGENGRYICNLCTPILEDIAVNGVRDKLTDYEND